VSAPLPPSPPIVSTSSFNTPAQMIAISWAINPESGTYDIFNAYTPATNEGNLLVIQSKILITLSTFQGEWAAQPDFGIPFASLNANSDNPDILAQIMVNEILTVQNVNSVNIIDFNYTATTRLFQATFNVNTLFGVLNMTVG